jgi:hypothetical protein
MGKSGKGMYRGKRKKKEDLDFVIHTLTSPPEALLCNKNTFGILHNKINRKEKAAQQYH